MENDYLQMQAEIVCKDGGLRAMYHRMTGRIVHPERISNFGNLVEYINSLFSNPNPTQE